MKNKTIFAISATITSLILAVIVMGHYAQKSYARLSSEGRDSVESTETPDASENPESSETPGSKPEDYERGPRTSSSVSPSVSSLGKPENASEQQSKAIEKINEAQSKLNELNLKLSKEVVTIPQNVQQLADLAGQRIADAKTALNEQDFGKAFGQAQSAESLIKNALRSLENEYEADKVKSDLNQEIEDEDIDSIEISKSASESGSLDIEHKDKSHSRRSVPLSSTSLFEIQTKDGTIGAHVASGSNAVIDNEGMDIESDFPITVNVASKSISVQTPSGVREIKVLPVRAFNQIDKRDKPDSFKKVELIQQDGKLIYQADGTREGKIFGFIPLTVSVTTAVDSQTGEIVSINKPWFINLMGPLFR